MKKSIVYIAGFMGSGKSTIGPILANALGWSFYDLDKVIEADEGKKIKQIFSDNGEDYFREAEKKTLRFLSQTEKSVIALGGGTIISQANIDLMKDTGLIIYLKASENAIYNRLKHKRDRPVLMPEGDEALSKEALMERIKKLFSAREKYYLKADIFFDTDNYTLGKCVDKLAAIVEHKLLTK